MIRKRIAVEPDRRSRAERLRDWFFPPRLELPEETVQVLRAVYPGLDLDRVSFHRGLPHFLRRRSIGGMALPAPLAPGRSRIYIQPWNWSPGTVEGLGLILHEAFHALQMQEAGPGLGLMRPFLVLYLACSARKSYARHPLEVDAYAVAGRRRSSFESTFRKGGVTPEACACLQVPTSRLDFWRRLAFSLPGWTAAVRLHRTHPIPARILLALLVPALAVWLLFWWTVVAVLGLAKMAVEGVGAVAVGILRIFSPNRI